LITRLERQSQVELVVENAADFEGIFFATKPLESQWFIKAESGLIGFIHS
jgi:hypothetical protein